MVNKQQIYSELIYKTARSSGAGGQHVNKVSSKVSLFFNILNSKGLSEREKTNLLKNIQSRLTKDSVLILSCDESRSQHRNKQLVLKRFWELIEKGKKSPKIRKETQPKPAILQKRKMNKKFHSVKKLLRKPPKIDSL